MSSRIVLLFAVAAVLALPVGASAHLLDHPVPQTTGTAPPLSTEFNSGGDNAEWELLATIPTFNPHSDIDFFSQGGKQYMSVGVLGTAANGGGQSIFQLTNEQGEIVPEEVSNHPSASCVSRPDAALGLQHDVEATPKGNAPLNTQFPGANRQDTQLIIDATDQRGRCHDQGTLGVRGAPRGGLEIVDVTDIAAPKEIALTSHIGESHTVNVDQRRPHIAYSVTSDTVGVNADRVRANESDPASFGLDGFEVVDIRSCLEAPLGTLPVGATLEQKREGCKPQVYRYRWPSVEIALGHTNQDAVNGCHELELYPDDRLTCAAGAALMTFDMSGAFDDNGTPTDFTDDKPRGTPLPCAVRDSTSLPLFQTGAKVTDCVGDADAATPAPDLRVKPWLDSGAPSLEGVKHLGSVFHMGRETTEGAVTPAYPSTEDIDFDHEAEYTESRRLLIASDERGGGVAGGAQCSPGADLEFANGGLHAYAADRLRATTPEGEDPEARAEEAFKAYARNSEGDKAIFRAPVRTEPKGSFCTAHVFQQVPGENRIFMGWYSQGTQVVDFVENADGTLDFKGAGYFVPENANQWVSHIFRRDINPDGTHTYYGATGDGIVGDAGRNGVDVYKVTLPAPPLPFGTKKLSNPEAVPSTPGGGSACAYTAGFGRTAARPDGRALEFQFDRRAENPVTVTVTRARDGKVVRRFRNRTSGFTWRPGSLRDGVYVARFTIKAADGTRDKRRIPVRMRSKRFRSTPDFVRPRSCGLVTHAFLNRPVFGGRGGTDLRLGMKVREAAQVTVTVTRNGKRVKRFTTRTVQPGERANFRLRGEGTKRGLHKVRIKAERGQSLATVTLASNRR